MRNTFLKAYAIIVICIFITVLLVITASIFNTKQNIIEQGEENLYNISENCANEFRSVMNHSEYMVDNLETLVYEKFSDAGFTPGEPVSDSLYSGIDKSISRMVEASHYPAAAYFVFSPEVAPQGVVIEYDKRKDGTVEAESNSNLVENYPGKDPIEAWGCTVILEAGGELWYEDVEWNVFSYGKAVYDDNGNLLGVVGADVYMEDVEELLASYSSKVGGVSCLKDKDGKVIAGSEVTGREDAYIFAESQIGDEWSVTVAEPEKELLRPLLKSELRVITIGVVIFLIVLGFLIYLYRKQGRPLMREIEYKDVLLINQARQAKLGEMVGNIAHQWKQPLNGANMALGNLREEYADKLEDKDREQFVMRVDRMNSLIENLAETMDDFIGFMKPEKEKHTFSIQEDIRRTLSMMEERISLSMISVEVKGEDFTVFGYRNQLQQCLFNLLDNAREALQKEDYGNRKIVITTGRDSNFNGYISVYNKGEPIPAETGQHIFELYYTTKEDSGGSGIGLYLTREIIETSFGGTVNYINRDNGVDFVITIPSGKALQGGSNELNQ